MKITVIHTSGPRAQARQSLASGQPIRLGRRPDNDLVFDLEADSTVSGHHAEISVEHGSVSVKDRGSTNGTWVNGERVVERELTASDKVRLGSVGGPEFRVEFESRAVPPPGEEKKYGQRTVGMMIQQALAQAGLLRPLGTTKTTDYFEALVEKNVRRTSSRLKWIIGASFVLLVAAGSALAWFIWSRPGALIQQINYGDVAGGGIAARNRHAVFLLAGSRLPVATTAGNLEGFCTAFAIGPDLLATNAHCVQLAGRYSSVHALMNGAPGVFYPVTDTVFHPGYKPGEISPDVGLMRVAARLHHLVVIADKSDLSFIAPGIVVFLYGFPGRLSNTEAPEATFIKGDIGRVTGFDQKLGDFGRNTLLQHSAFSSGGTSGSPMFNSSGKVIGINAGGYVEDGQALPGYNFGMRIDLVHSLYPLLEGRR